MVEEEQHLRQIALVVIYHRYLLASLQLSADVGQQERLDVIPASGVDFCMAGHSSDFIDGIRIWYFEALGAECCQQALSPIV
ncbi:hypothetical protein D3C71_1327120 [compost metagenome]